jgi:two-component system, LytTR family, response regulator
VFHVDDIDWIEADEYYVKLYINGRSHMVRQTMGAIEEQLPADRFVRIHRSTIVNLQRVAALEPSLQGDLAVVLHDGTRLRVSRRRRDALSSVLTNFS